MNCLIYLSLGKVFSRLEDGAPLGEVRLQGVYDETRKSWASRDELFGRAIEGFLIRHRNHEIRFVPEGVDELLESETSPVHSVDVNDVVSPGEAIDVDPGIELSA